MSPQPKPNLKERAVAAVFEVASQFGDVEVEPSLEPPVGATVQEVWTMYRETWKAWNDLRIKRRVNKPKVETCVKALLTNAEYSDFSNGLIADIVRKVHAQFGYRCECSARSVGWYISQKGREWDIVPRREAPMSLDWDEGW